MSGDPPITLFNIPIKWFVLALLVIQNAGAVLFMRSVRVLPGETQFVPQTAVIMQEVFKGLTCVLIILKADGNLNSVIAIPAEALKTAVPAILYLAQNNLQYLAAGLLDAPTYAVTYQSKLLWVGILSVVMLKRTLGLNKWLALALLAGGVAIAQISGQAPVAETSQASEQAKKSVVARFAGLILILIAALCSSLAGVYFEKILKGARTSLWARNLQLAGYSVITGMLVALCSKDNEQILDKGFFHGYTGLTWACILMNAFGGLLVGAVIKYADAIMKDMAIGASIVLSSIGSIPLFGFIPTPVFLVGVVLVSYAVPLYGGRVDCGGLLVDQAAQPALPSNQDKEPLVPQDAKVIDMQEMQDAKTSPPVSPSST